MQDDFSCELAGWRDHKCYDGLHRHHVVNKSKLRGNPKALRYVEQNMYLFGARVCGGGNINREADTKEAQAFFWRNRVATWGEEYCRAELDALRRLFKVPPMDLRLDALLCAEDKI